MGLPEGLLERMQVDEIGGRVSSSRFAMVTYQLMSEIAKGLSERLSGLRVQIAAGQ